MHESTLVKVTLAMKEWLVDCYPDEEVDIIEASYEQLKRAVIRDFEGGLPAFLESMGY